MKKLLIYLRDYKKECVLSPLFKLLEASFELIVPLVMAAIIDKGIALSDRPYIFHMGGVLVLLALIGLTCAITAQFFAAKAAVGFSTKLRHVLFAHIETLSFSEMDTIGTSTLITRMTSDINQVQSGVNMVLRLFLRSPFIVFGAMIMAFTVNVKAALVFVVAIPFLSVVVFSVMAASIPLFKKVQKGLDQVLGHTRENLEGARVIRAFNKEEWEQKEFYEAMVEKIHAEKRLLAPDCATCGAPCGKTADYDINQWKKEAEPVREQKILLLKRLVEVALAYRDSAEVGYLLTKALFALGESWETEWVKVLVKEADGYLVSKEDY